MDLPVGTVVVPDKCYHFDGVYHKISFDREVGVPDPNLLRTLRELFETHGVLFKTGTNISVPAVTLQLPHANEYYRKIKPISLEMELAACLSRASDIGLRAVGVLVISDNKEHIISAEQTREKRREALKSVLDACISNLTELDLKPLPHADEFSVDNCLATIVGDPEDATNAYHGSQSVKLDSHDGT